MTDDRTPSEPNVVAWTRRPAAVWAAARADYLAGATAAEACERHGLSKSTFRWRARTEGWRRADQPEGSVFEPLGLAELGHLDTSLPFNAADMARLAWSHAGRALREGKLIEARGWSRLHNDLTLVVKADKELLSWHRICAKDPKRRHFAEVTPLRPIEEN
ncbi:hypothetical protein [Brevundimonas sp. SH203]|uniref:hypothetical protein n=1 Tax=Brevundimonas sp. SH203 TaxID=345167 RepID=UPI00135650F6|nr:hypothetical protein [Brevundimonas sp. SH203]